MAEAIVYITGDAASFDFPYALADTGPLPP